MKKKKRGGGGRNLPREMIRDVGGYDRRRTRSGVKWEEMEGRGKGMSVIGAPPDVLEGGGVLRGYARRDV